MASSNSQIDKPQRGRPKRAELPDVNINTGAQSIDTERATLRESLSAVCKLFESLLLKVRSAVSRGDFAQAQAASLSARNFAYLSVGLGLAFLILYIIIVVLWIIPVVTAVGRHDF